MTAFFIIVIGIVLILLIATDGFGIIRIIRERKNRHPYAELYSDHKSKKNDTGTFINKFNKPRR
ncbi:MAG: hypothetical protein K6C68_12820 [Ruminococcus sp.]|nr:hypothetical protein [Ruminococcus sp.]